MSLEDYKVYRVLEVHRVCRVIGLLGFERDIRLLRFIGLAMCYRKM